jgi:phage gp29-like protein
MPKRTKKPRAASHKLSVVAGPYDDVGMPPTPKAYGPPKKDFGKDAPPPPDVVSQGDPKNALAPRPLIDRYPIIIGSGLTFAYLSSVQRVALVGYRMQYVDLLREILERDPHLFAVVRKPILAISNGRMEITPAKLPEGHPDTNRAKKIAADLAYRLSLIKGLRQSIYTLGWGSFYGVSAAENHFAQAKDGSWIICKLGFIHSRRISFPDTNSWDLFVWDQGQVAGSEPYGMSPTNANMFGLRVADWPHKFIVYSPQISGDYPTREGSGRLVAEWALIKRTAARNALRYLEQFSKPIPEVTFNTADPDSEGSSKPREATEEDIVNGENAAAAIASGTLASFTHADSTKLGLLTPEARNNKITFDKLLEVCNEEESKGTLGSTLTTNVGAHGGNRALGEVHAVEEKNVFSFFADTMAEALREQLLTPLVLLNHDDAEHLIPQMKIHVEDEDPKSILKMATDAAGFNIEVDGDRIAEEIGLPVVPKPAGVKYRPMFPLDLTKPVELNPELAPKPDPDTLEGAKLEIQTKKAASPAKPFGNEAPKPNAKPAKKVAAADREDPKPSHKIGVAVYHELESDYPDDALEWIPRYKWAGPVEIPLDEIDFSNSKSWRASKEPESVAYHTIKIHEGKRKPIILVKTPKDDKYIIVDGHHRSLAYQHLNKPALAFVANVDKEKGEWDWMHDEQEGSDQFSKQVAPRMTSTTMRDIPRDAQFEATLAETVAWLEEYRRP